MPRELIEPHKRDKRYVRRDKEGRFSKELDVGKSLSAARRTTSNTVANKGAASGAYTGSFTVTAAYS